MPESIGDNETLGINSLYEMPSSSCVGNNKFKIDLHCIDNYTATGLYLKKELIGSGLTVAIFGWVV